MWAYATELVWSVCVCVCVCDFSCKCRMSPFWLWLLLGVVFCGRKAFKCRTLMQSRLDLQMLLLLLLLLLLPLLLCGNSIHWAIKSKNTQSTTYEIQHIYIYAWRHVYTNVLWPERMKFVRDKFHWHLILFSSAFSIFMPGPPTNVKQWHIINWFDSSWQHTAGACTQEANPLSQQTSCTLAERTDADAV